MHPALHVGLQDAPACEELRYSAVEPGSSQLNTSLF